MIKKLFIYAALLLVFTSTVPRPVQAASLTTTIQQMIDASIAPLQTAISDLQTRVSAIEISVNNILTRLFTAENNIGNLNVAVSTHEARLAILENARPDFTPPAGWTLVLSSTGVPLAQPVGTFVWNGININPQQIETRAVAHLSVGDFYAVGNGKLVQFDTMTAFVSRGTTVSIDFDFFWQGNTKHSQVIVTIP